jgi:hypothetical protein
MSLRLLIAIACAGCAASHKEADEPRPVTDVSPLEQKLAQNPDDPKVNLELGDRAARGGDCCAPSSITSARRRWACPRRRSCRACCASW